MLRGCERWRLQSRLQKIQRRRATHRPRARTADFAKLTQQPCMAWPMRLSVSLTKGVDHCSNTYGISDPCQARLRQYPPERAHRRRRVGHALEAHEAVPYLTDKPSCGHTDAWRLWTHRSRVRGGGRGIRSARAAGAPGHDHKLSNHPYTLDVVRNARVLHRHGAICYRVLPNR